MDDFREWLSDNLRYILLGCAVVLVAVIIICIVKAVGGSSGKPSTATTETAGKAEAQSETPAASASAALESSDLVRNDPEILSLVQTYYTAVASEDTATLATIMNPWTEEIQSKVLANTDIEAYNNISTYSKDGPEEQSYVVFAYYEGKLKNIATSAPSLAMLYVTTDDSGNLVVSDRNASQEVADFISNVSKDADVQALIQDVNAQLASAAAQDADLKAYLDSHSSASAEKSTESDSASEVGTDSDSSTATTTAGVNIRATADSSGSILGVTYAGAEVTVIEKGDEWTHISFTYNGSTLDGYVATQYLDFGDSTGETTDTTASAGSDAAADSASSGTADAAANNLSVDSADSAL